MQRNYFSHDSTARNDPKIIALISEFGMEGYGRFFVLCEIFREQDDYQLKKDICLTATLTRELYATKDEVEKFISFCVSIGLLLENENNIWSDSFLRRMQKKDDVSVKRQQAAKERWKSKDETEDSNNTEELLDSEEDTNAMQLNDKERKKEKKESKVSKEEKEISLSPEKKPAILFDEIAEFYNTICKKLKPIKALTDKRRSHIRARSSDLKTIEDWKNYFEKVNESDFLAGDNNRGWSADFDWLISSKTNMLKVLEGKYAPKNPVPGVAQKYAGLNQFRE